MSELEVIFVGTFQEAGATSHAGRVRLRVARDWEATVAKRNLTEVRDVFPVAVEAIVSPRPDVELWRARCVPISPQLRRPTPDGPWLPDGERLLPYVRNGFEEGFLARTSCGLGSAFHETQTGAVIRAVRHRGRQRSLQTKNASVFGICR